MRFWLVLWLLYSGLSGWCGEPIGPPAAAVVAPPPVFPLIEKFAKQRGIVPVITGTGAFRALELGPSGLKDLAKDVQLGCDALERLERWTGGPGIFVPVTVDNPTACWMLIIKDEGVFNAWVDFGRLQGLIPQAAEENDLAKKLKGFAMPGAVVSTAGRLAHLEEQFAVYAAACVALDRVAAAQGRRRLPAWLREGLAAELQRALTGTIRCTTISYQANDSKEAITDNWMADVKQILRERTITARGMAAEFVLTSTTDLISPSAYRQIWSLCTFLRLASDAAAKPKNTTRLWAVIEATAKGTDSLTAVKDIYGITPADLDTAWRLWANKGIAPPTK